MRRLRWDLEDFHQSRTPKPFCDDCVASLDFHAILTLLKLVSKCLIILLQAISLWIGTLECLLLCFGSSKAEFSSREYPDTFKPVMFNDRHYESALALTPLSRSAFVSRLLKTLTPIEV